MRVVNDRTKVVVVKMKDPKLYKEIKDNIRNSFYIYNQRNWKIMYDELILPNNKVVSTMKDVDGRCILHHVFIDRTILKGILIQLIEAFPHLIELPDNQREIAFTQAITYRHSKTIMLKMLELCPNALQVRIKGGGYPLNCAIKYECEKVFVLKLLHMFPQACEVSNTYGDSTLQIALESNTHESVIFKLIELFPQAIEKRNDRGTYPLQTAMESQRSETLVIKMTELFPNAVEVPTRNGDFVLEWAVYNKKCPETFVRMLLELCPGVIGKMADTKIQDIVKHTEKNKKLKTVHMKLNQLLSNKKLKTK